MSLNPMEKKIDKEIKVSGSGFTQWVASQRWVDKDSAIGDGGTSEFSSGDPQLELENFTPGDCLNLYEKLILNSKWNVIDGEIGSTFVLARPHMFYTPNNSIIKKIESLSERNIQDNLDMINGVFNKKNPLTVFDDITSMLVDLNTLEADVGVISEYKNSLSHNKRDDSVYEILKGESTKRVSENHLVVSSYNLIFHEIAVDNNCVNTVRMDYEKMNFIDKMDIITVLPFIKEGDPLKSKVIEKKVMPMINQVDRDFKFWKISTWMGEANKARSIEFLSNELLNELRWCYQGKIFMKHNPEIKAGDTITLLDDVTSTYGKFLIDSYEHILDSRGMVTIASVRACMDLVDPVLDAYGKSIALELSADLAKTFETKTSIESEIIAVKNLMSYYNKIALQQYRYGKIYNMEEQGMLDSSGEYPEVDNSVYAPALAIRFIPMMKKGKVQVPESIKSAFYYSETSPFKSLLLKISNTAKDKVYSMFNTTKGWANSFLRYSADFLISIPTFNLHELLKVSYGMTQEKAKGELRGNSNIDDKDLEVLANDTDYSSWSSSENYDITIGFFNVMAQRKTNLLPGVTNDDVEVDYITLRDKAKAKASVINKIIKDKFDICGCVEMYDSFSFEGENEDYKINNFIDDCRPNNFSTKSENLFSNSYGTEQGVLFYKNNLFNENQGDKRIFKQTTKTFPTTSGDGARNYVETTIDISSLNYLTKSGGKLSEIKVIWFHNIFGSDDQKIDSRVKNIKHLVDTYGKLASENEEIGIIIMGDHNIEVVNPNSKPRGTDNSYLFLGQIENFGFRNFMTKPTTLSKNGQVTGSIYENVLLSESLIINKAHIDVSRFMYPYAKKNEISDHVPAFVGLKKRS
ncbi:MAG: hypothetical protein ACRCTZ_00330 [Sarcina sp.]